MRLLSTRLTQTAAALAFLVAASPGRAEPLVRPPDPRRPMYVLAHVDVLQEHTREAIIALQAYVAATRQEHGAESITAVQELRPNHFDLIEVWRDAAAYRAHEESSATLRLKTVIAPWRGSPYEERLGAPLPLAGGTAEMVGRGRPGR